MCGSAPLAGRRRIVPWLWDAGRSGGSEMSLGSLDVRIYLHFIGIAVITRCLREDGAYVSGGNTHVRILHFLGDLRL